MDSGRLSGIYEQRQVLGCRYTLLSRLAEVWGHEGFDVGYSQGDFTYEDCTSLEVYDRHDSMVEG
jgi:hypothetical protein